MEEGWPGSGTSVRLCLGTRLDRRLTTTRKLQAGPPRQAIPLAEAYQRHAVRR